MKRVFKAVLIAALVSVSATAAKKGGFVISFGDGGFERYEIIDNSCYVYTLVPKSLKEAPKSLNSALTASMINAKKQYGKKASGFINLQVYTVSYKNAIVYQVCGDIVKSSKRRK